MSEVLPNLKYTESHEWVLDNGDGTVTIGITDHAQVLLGDLVYVGLPEVGAVLAKGDDCAVVESFKAASDIYAPLDGEVVEVNEALSSSPELINQSPYADGWIFKLAVQDTDQLDELMTSDAYIAAVSDEAED